MEALQRVQELHRLGLSSMLHTNQQQTCCIRSSRCLRWMLCLSWTVKECTLNSHKFMQIAPKSMAFQRSRSCHCQRLAVLSNQSRSGSGIHVRCECATISTE